jgi:hypothetical protein
MLAVSGTLYRLYTNILRELVTKWCVENRKVHDTQFGFYPDRSTIQPMFILRHLVHAAKQNKPKGCSHLHAAFIDFKQAYDTIDRPHLWDHYNNIRMLTHLVNVVKQMYDGDEYVLIDGAKTTSTGNSTVPLRSVKQGCPLSPLLFSLFIKDVDNEFGSAFVGAVTGTEGLRVTRMLYADDLTLTANDPVQLQKMLRRPELYAARKGLTVNVQKSYIVNFNAYRNSAVPVFCLYNSGA